MEKTLHLDGYELSIGHILGDVSWNEEAQEWRALVVTNNNALVVAVVTVSALDNWYDRKV